MNILELSSEVSALHIGPSLEKGPLPAVFYFALSASESLALDPYNQPALYLAKRGIRVFSLDLPAHGKNLKAEEAIFVWAKEFEKGGDPLTPFFAKILFALNALIEKGLVLPEKIGLMGLSRGGLIASHITMQFPIKALVGFAPMTELTFAKEFTTSPEKATFFNLQNHIEKLCDKPLRFYMGNRDLRVSTEKCCFLVLNLANRAFEKGIRSPPIELILSPSIGHMGHGTSKEVFEAGADFLYHTLEGIA